MFALRMHQEVRAVYSTRIEVCHNECMGLCVAQKLRNGFLPAKHQNKPHCQALHFGTYVSGNRSYFPGAFSRPTHFSACLHGHMCTYIVHIAAQVCLFEKCRYGETST